MAPPVAPREGLLQVSFVDFPRSIAQSAPFTRTTKYLDFLQILTVLSGNVVHKLENLPYQYVQGQGFSLIDGGWWFRYVKPLTENIIGAMPELSKGPWTFFDNVFSYEKMIGELSLGLEWEGAWVEFQHVCPSTLYLFQKGPLLIDYRTYRRRETMPRKKGRERPQSKATRHSSSAAL